MSHNNVSLSIIIPAYNEQDHIKDCLDAIATQTIRPDEVIVVDNASTDATAKIAKSYPFVRLIHEPRRGIAYARDAGFNAASSTYLGRIDADTVVPTDWVQQIHEFYAVKANRSVALTGGATFRNVPAPRLAGWAQKQLAFRMSWLALGHHILWGSNMAVPSKSWTKVKGEVCHAPVIHEDIDLAIHLHRRGVKIVYKPKLQVNAALKRIYSDQNQLWFNLKWWPRTLKRHNKKRWPITFTAALTVYVLALITHLFSSERRTKSVSKP